MDRKATSDRREHQARPGSEPIVTARRRLVQGMFAAPAVLTLHSGSALANTSSYSCMTKLINNPVSPEPGYIDVADPANTYVRVQLWTLRPSASSSNVRHFIRGDDINNIAIEHPYVTNGFLQNDYWLEFNPATPPSVIGAATSETPSQGANSILAHDGGYVALRFDGAGQDFTIIGVVGSGEGGSVISGSCWSSFAGTAG